MLTEERKEKLIRLCSDLVKIKSYSGREADMASHLAQIFKINESAEVTVDAYGSVAARFRGTQPGKTLLLDAHIDTVPVTDPSRWETDPFGGEVKNGRIFGRGASDMKGALAAMVLAVDAFVSDTQHNFGGEIVVVGGVQEEAFEGIASRRISKAYNPDYVVIGEASGLSLKRGQRGRAEIVLETFGKPAHSANPTVGLNAVYKMTALIDAIRGLPVGRHPVLGDGILELTDIKSSPYPGLSVVPEYCRATYDRRLLVGETRESVLTPVRELIAALGKEDPAFKAEASYAVGSEDCYTNTPIEAERFFPAWIYDQDDEFVQTAYRGLKSAGLTPQISHYAFCTNGSHYAGEAGIKTIGFGPSEESLAHVDNEYIEIAQLVDGCRGYYGILNAALKG
jgi:putative selenium metabolism hydrolase